MEFSEKEAHAKINLTLSIKGKREDGYHTLETVMQEISLADRVRVEKTEEGITFSCDDSALPTDEHNLCVKAAKAYFAHTGVAGGCAISLEKKIPYGTGLGGGSSDAAAVLLALDELYPAEADLMGIAAGIGADVPFFLAGGTALCTGIGEEVTPLWFPGKEGLWCVIAKKGKSLSTPAVYAAFDALGPRKRGPSYAQLAEAMTWGAPEAVYPFLYNDLEEAAVSLEPKIRDLIQYLQTFGAEAAQMTGSGSAVFALFREREKAAWAAANAKQSGAETHLCRLI